MSGTGDFLLFQGIRKEILPYKMSAAGENFAVPVHYKGHFALQNERRRRHFWDFAFENRICRGEGRHLQRCELVCAQNEK